MTKKSKGFTLIELLVVIAIIGILATIVLVSVASSRRKARDTRRISDMRQVSLALEMYYDDNVLTGYPGDVDAATCDDWAALVTALEGSRYISRVPTDPGGTSAYAYNTDLKDYVLRAQLESATHSALATDVDGTALGCICTDNGGVSPDANRYYCIEP